MCFPLNLSVFLVYFPAVDDPPQYASLHNVEPSGWSYANISSEAHDVDDVSEARLRQVDLRRGPPPYHNTPEAMKKHLQNVGTDVEEATQNVCFIHRILPSKTCAPL